MKITVKMTVHNEYTLMGQLIREHLDDEIARLQRIEQAPPRDFEVTIEVISPVGGVKDITRMTARSESTSEEILRRYIDAKQTAKHITRRRS